MVSEAKKYGIGEVQELLKEEFSDITISKIRFLEKEGLVSPERTPSGYRKFTKANIKQLSYILRLQREEYLPLSVIKRKIQDLESGKVRAGDLTVMAGGVPSIEGEVSVSVDLAPSKLGLSAETVSELIDFDIVHVTDGPEGKYFAPEDMKVLGIAREFSRYGIEPRHLRMFSQFVGREAALVEQVVRPQLQRKDSKTRHNAIKDMENLMSLCQMLTQALLNKGLSKYLPRHAQLDIPDEEPPENENEHTGQPGETETTPAEDSPKHVGNPEREMFPER